MSDKGDINDTINLNEKKNVKKNLIIIIMLKQRIIFSNEEIADETDKIHLIDDNKS